MNDLAPANTPTDAAEHRPALGRDGSTVTPRHVYLVDGSGYIFRAYHALPPLNRSDGTPTSAVLGFSNMLAKLLAETECDHIAVIFDHSGSSFRHQIYDQYKANRNEPPDDLKPQFKLVRDATKAFGVCCIEAANYEADDLIATYAREAAQAGAIVTIVSSDKDMMQLVRDRVTMLDPIKNRPIGAAEVRERFGVDPDKVIEVQALCGDSVDNVPGVPGIGVKTASELINTYGNLENLLEHAPEIKQPKRRESLIEHAAKARLSRELVKLDDQVPLPCPLTDLAVKPIDPNVLLPWLRQMEFRTLGTRMSQKLADAQPATVEAVASEPVVPTMAPFAEDPKYALIDTLEGLDHWIEAATEAGVVAIHPAPGLAGIALALAPGMAAYVPLAHRAGNGQGSLDLAPPRSNALPAHEVMAQLKPLLEDRGTLKIGHDVKGAAKLLLRHGIRIAPYDCTMLMSYVLDGGQFGHEIEELLSRVGGHNLKPLKELVGSGKSLISFAEVAPEAARDFAAERADAALRLHAVLKARLVAEHMTAFYETVERPLVPAVAAMEHAGIKVDRGALGELSTDFARRIAEIEAAIYRDVGNAFNIGSPKQLGDVLFDKLQLPGGRKGKTGAYGTDASILEQLSPLHPVPAQVLEWRQLTKLKSTYADALVDEIDAEDQRVHTTYALTVAATGRFSSNDPNLQNIPVRTEEGRKIRAAFVAEPGHVLLSADYSQIELRLAAHVADIAALKDAFLAGHDIHAATASEVFNVPMDQMTPLIRRRAKAINFGILYGISAFGLGNQIGVPQGEAKAYIDLYFERFPGIRAYMERIKAECRSAGYVETIFGRKCFIPGIRDANPARRMGAERQAINAPLQGSAADIIKRAMGRIPAALATAGLRARMLLQVHDELLFETPEDEIQATASLVKEVMEGACAPRCELSVPLVVDTGWARTWDAAH
ncbi:MAG TPA: DNA polymerase I [Stellaceae bacterium]|nr:DNA polymerase I [Stellaceae bacterium]